tara:strand:- start:177 stop:686 length:510 start_codon:yes stop_codon:yes gene_type:complete
VSKDRWTLRLARTPDVEEIQKLVLPLVESRVLLGKDSVSFYEDIQEFSVVEAASKKIVACGALHVLWRDIGEIRTLAVAQEYLGRGIGSAIVSDLEERAKSLGLQTLFCLSFQVTFFQKNGFGLQQDSLLAPEVLAELARSPDEGVAEFLDLERVRPNTLGNSRLVKKL